MGAGGKVVSALNSPQKRLYNVREAAVYLGRTEWAVREMYYRGKIPCVRDGSRVLFDIVDLDAWIEKSKTQLIY